MPSSIFVVRVRAKIFFGEQSQKLHYVLGDVAQKGPSVKFVIVKNKKSRSKPGFFTEKKTPCNLN